MELVRLLHMNGGDGEKSYVRNSLLPRKALSISKAIKEEAIHKLYERSGRTMENVTIADLGCSSGPAVRSLFSDLIKAFNEVRLTLGEQKPPLNFTFYLNDLPGNDFNTIFKTMSSFQETLKEELKEVGHCFIYGVPGSFYGRLFPSHSLNFFHSSFSVHWLSKIPQDIKTSNKGNIHISKTSSTKVVDGYYYQFRSDFLKFLTCRSEEIVNEGWMVLTLIGRRSDHRSSKESFYLFELLAIVLNQMVSEGLIEEEKMDSFNIPLYFPSPKEIEDIVKDEGSFTINRLEIFEIDWNLDTSLPDMYIHVDKLQKNAGDTNGDNNKKIADIDDRKFVNIASTIRAVTEPILVDHFGEVITEDAFKRYNCIVADVMAKERNNYVTTVTVSLYKDLGLGSPNQNEQLTDKI